MMTIEVNPHANLRKLINVVDGLRDVGVQRYLNLPRICVVGTQSAGKSSVLEAIVGIDFLPRGEGVVTRRPLELRLVHVAQSAVKDGVESWAVFEERKESAFTDFNLVRQTIEAITDEGAGANKGISPEPIVLTIYSTQCPDLTLIDLPGITRVPLKGSDQTDDIERRTRAMASRYAKDPRTIILAVIAANTDMSTSDALQLARMEDPSGVRTIGVITKIDLMDKGTDARNMLNGEDVPLRLGYTGVRNRSQADIRLGKGIQEALQEEKEFFETHPIYKHLPKEMLGTQALVDKLTRVLFRHIKLFLPEIRREINSRARIAQEELSLLGTGVPVDSQDRAHLIWALITDFCDVFRNVIRGKFDKKIQYYFDSNHISSGSQIRSIFYDLLCDKVDDCITKQMTDNDIDTAVRMYEGDSLPGFPSPDTFEYLILPHLKTIQEPVMDCLDQVAHSLDSVSDVVATKVFERFPALSSEVMEQMANLIERQKQVAGNILESIVTSETGYLFTNDQSYLSQHGSMIPIKDTASEPAVNEEPPTDPTVKKSIHYSTLFQKNARTSQATSVSATAASAVASIQNTVSNMWMAEKKTHYSTEFIQEIRSRLDAYFSIVVHNIRDCVPKIIGYFLVRQLQAKMQYELYRNLSSQGNLGNFLAELPHITERRLALTQQISTFTKAVQILQRDPCFNVPHGSSEFDEAYDHDLAAMQRKVHEGAELSSSMDVNHKNSLNKSLFSATQSSDKCMDRKSDNSNKSGNLFSKPNYSTNSASFAFSDPPPTNPLYS